MGFFFVKNICNLPLTSATIGRNMNHQQRKPAGDTKMNQAAEIMYSSKNANDAIERAEAAKAGVTHDWDHSFYTFEDGSVKILTLCGKEAGNSKDGLPTPIQQATKEGSRRGCKDGRTAFFRTTRKASKEKRLSGRGHKHHKKIY